MTQHSPGPWNIWPTIDKNNEEVECNLVVGPQAGGVAVADIVAATAHGIVTQDSYETGRANARLIAAAPDLLAALKGLLIQAENLLDQRVTHDGLTNCDVIAKARKAIAQAEGGASHAEL